MPYTITTRRPDGPASRHTVATLWNARAMVRDSIDRARDDMRGWRDCSDEWANSRSFLGIDFQIGGVIGPLPDEITTIEVSPIQWRTIYETIGWQDRFADWEPEFDDHDQALAAFNAH